MSRVAQAPVLWFLAGLPSRRLGSALLVCASFLLSGCGSGGFSLSKAEVDHSLLTSDVGAYSASANADRRSDEATIRNAVSSADLEMLGGQPVPWANAATGARGSITELKETKAGNQPCRAFRTSRESFDGVRMFKGMACMVGAGAWRMESFEAL